MEDFLNFLKVIWPMVIAGVTLVVIGTIAARFALAFRRFRGLELRFDRIEDKVGEIDQPRRIQDVIHEKRERLLKIPNVSFHYADKERITSFYNDYFKEPTVETLFARWPVRLLATSE